MDSLPIVGALVLLIICAFLAGIKVGWKAAVFAIVKAVESEQAKKGAPPA